jgi:Zn-finger nucleic acid-binding protein
MSDHPQHEGMTCPICKVDLVMGEREKLEIDYCPKCRGVWLDRGKLDKIIERAAAADAPGVASAQSQPAPSPWTAPQSQSQPPHDYGAPDPHYGQSGKHRGGHHGRDDDRSFFGRLFD